MSPTNGATQKELGWAALGISSRASADYKHYQDTSAFNATRHSRAAQHSLTQAVITLAFSSHLHQLVAAEAGSSPFGSWRAPFVCRRIKAEAGMLISFVLSSGDHI